ncbi:MAG: uracil-DNA glycosylase [Anaerolineales bacterium]|nr:uracil-DNA glycosylase [Anaerolineales bacterium]
MDSIQAILDTLTDYSHSDVFNQYAEEHPKHDISGACRIRRNNLRLYLNTFIDVKIILLAEAAGYQGCRFSGIPMTSEEHIAGPDPVAWARNNNYKRSSTRDRLWREPSATILWETLENRMDCLIWNTFPWHPMGKRGELSNRTPRADEVSAGIQVLDLLIARYSDARIVAIGRIAEKTLKNLDINPIYVRHPAHGGKPEFVKGINSLR